MARQKQNAIPGFEQEKINEIETWADKFDDTRSTIDGLNEELKNAEFKLKEAMHANEAKLGKQVQPGKGKVLVYEKNGYKVKVKEKGEAVNVKISDKQKGTAPEA
jgi:gas vesicle protein